MKVLISTDTSCVMEYGLLEKNGINVFPLNVIIDGQEYLDGVTINQDELCQAMRSGKDIKTSTPPLGQIYEYFENLFSEGYDKIIHFTISSKLSSMYDLFMNVANNEFKGKLYVIDAYSVSAIMLSHVLYAKEEIEKGTDVEDIVMAVEERKKNASVLFVPENLTALKNGGRISPTVALIGNAIGIKPVISLKEGALEKEGVTRHVRKTMIEGLEKFKLNYPENDYDYTIVKFDAKPEVLDYILDNAKKIFPDKKILVGMLPINVCAHCGPGTVGIIASKKINGKSLSEYFVD